MTTTGTLSRERNVKRRAVGFKRPIGDLVGRPIGRPVGRLIRRRIGRPIGRSIEARFGPLLDPRLDTQISANRILDVWRHSTHQNESLLQENRLSEWRMLKKTYVFVPREARSVTH